MLRYPRDVERGTLSVLGALETKYRETWAHDGTSIMAGSKLVLEGRVSVKAFVLGLGVVLIPLLRTWFGHLDWVFDYLTETPGKIAVCVYVAAVNGLLLVIYRGPLYKVTPEAADSQVFMFLFTSNAVRVSGKTWSEFKH